MVWSFALEDKEDLERLKGLGWGLRTWDQWEWNDCDKRFNGLGDVQKAPVKTGMK